MTALKYLISFSLLALSSLASAQVVLPLVGDAANSSAPVLNSSIANTLNDSFTYEPLDPTSSLPTLVFLTSTPETGYHAAEPNSGLVTLTYTLDQPFPDDAMQRQLVLDLWGRDGGSGSSKATIESRDDDFDIEIFDGATSLSKLTSLGIDGDHHSRADFGLLPLGANVTKIVVTARQSQTGANSTTDNAFTLMEIRAAVFSQDPIIVTTLADELDEPAGNDLSLREAIRDALPTSEITFAPALNGGTIQLDASLGQLVIAKSLTIDASALPDGITIDGGSNGDLTVDANETRCFFIFDGDDGNFIPVTLTNLTIQNGSISGSGANIANLENLTLENCRILDGFSTSFGGGINNGTGSLTMNACVVSGNRSRGFGGGIASRVANLTISNCTISENIADSDGGGIDSLGNITMTACTISGNTSLNADGGGLHHRRSGEMIIEHCTIVGNSASSGRGAGIANSSGEISISHSIIRDNSDGLDLALVDGSTNSFTFSGENIIGTLGGGISGITPNTDPILLAPLGDYGGPTETTPPLFGSPAIDAAISSTATADQRGFLIIDTPDIGAAETFFTTVTVTTITDELDPIATDGTGISLREAIRDTEGGGFIFFAPELDGGQIDLDATRGELIIGKSLIIDASDLPNGITIDGGSNGDFVKNDDEIRCLIISDGNANKKLEVTLNHLTIQNGVCEGEEDAGANIDSRENLTLIDCDILNGYALDDQSSRNVLFGGGINNENGNLTLRNCTVSGNQALGFDVFGGGICSFDGNVTLTNCTVSGNQIEGVEYASGGGIFSQGGNLTLTNCTISENLNIGNFGDGGGISHFRANATLTNCTVSGNQVQGEGSIGGGIAIFLNGEEQTARLTRCTITGNSALDADGGGIFFANFRGGRTIIEHCTIVGNSTGNGNGAGIASDDDDSSETEISHSIVQNNLGGSDLALENSEAFNSFTFSGENLIGTVGPNITNAPTLSTRPLLLAPLGDYGGPTETMPPLFGSPAINAAISSTATEDQRGFAIIGTPDIGATEFQGEDDPFSDADNDDLVRILELALGTDPDVADFNAEGRLKIATSNDRNIILALGRGSNFIPGTVLIVERSTTLQEGSFEEVYRFDFDTETSTPAAGIISQVLPDQFIITDNEQPEGRAFYRLRATLSPN